MAVIAFAPVVAQGTSYNADDLSWRLSRTISLADTFFKRFDRFVDSYAGGSSYTGGVASMDGSWFDGYSIKTDFGDQAGVLGKVYGDLFLPLSGKKVSLLVGLGGYRYGVFLSGISMPLPSGDPLHSGGLTVTDFAGTQYFQDIYAASLAFRSKGSITAYYAANSLYAPRAGVLDFKLPLSVTGYYGVKANAFGVLRGDMLLSDAFVIQRASGAFDPLALLDMLAGTRVAKTIFARSSLLWRAFKTLESGLIPFDWKKFLVPTELGLNLGSSLAIESGFSLCSPTLKESLGSWLRSAWGGVRVRMFLEGVGLASMGASVSWFTDPRLAMFSGSTIEAIGNSVEISIDTRHFSVRLGTRYDYHVDLDDLIESYGHRVFFCNLVLSNWNLSGLW